MLPCDVWMETVAMGGLTLEGVMEPGQGSGSAKKFSGRFIPARPATDQIGPVHQ